MELNRSRLSYPRTPDKLVSPQSMSRSASFNAPERFEEWTNTWEVFPSYHDILKRRLRKSSRRKSRKSSSKHLENPREALSPLQRFKCITPPAEARTSLSTPRKREQPLRDLSPHKAWIYPSLYAPRCFSTPVSPRYLSHGKSLQKLQVVQEESTSSQVLELVEGELEQSPTQELAPVDVHNGNLKEKSQPISASARLEKSDSLKDPMESSQRLGARNGNKFQFFPAVKSPTEESTQTTPREGKKKFIADSILEPFAAGKRQDSSPLTRRYFASGDYSQQARATQTKVNSVQQKKMQNSNRRYIASADYSSLEIHKSLQLETEQEKELNSTPSPTNRRFFASGDYSQQVRSAQPKVDFVQQKKMQNSNRRYFASADYSSLEIHRSSQAQIDSLLQKHHSFTKVSGSNPQQTGANGSSLKLEKTAQSPGDPPNGFDLLSTSGNRSLFHLQKSVRNFEPSRSAPGSITIGYKQLRRNKFNSNQIVDSISKDLEISEPEFQADRKEFIKLESIRRPETTSKNIEDSKPVSHTNRIEERNQSFLFWKRAYHPSLA